MTNRGHATLPVRAESFNLLQGASIMTDQSLRNDPAALPPPVRNALEWNAFLEATIYPLLTADLIFTHVAHSFHKSPTKWRGGCPWHQSKSGTSFTVDPGSLRWYCAGCAVGGHVLQYLDRRAGGDGVVRGQRFFDLIRQLCALVKVDFPQNEMSEEEKALALRLETRRAILEATVLHCQQQLGLPEAEPARAYLQQRGFHADHLLELEIGLYACPERLRKYLLAAGFDEQAILESSVLWPKARGYATFPWRDEVGRMLTLYGQITPLVDPGHPKKLAWPNPRDPQGHNLEHTKRSPYCLQRALAARHQRVVVVEGLTDAALLQALGQTDVIGIVAGLLSQDQIHTLQRRHIEAVVLALDPDQAGDRNLDSNIVRLAQAGIRPYVAPRLPEGVDPDRFVLQHGVQGWQQHLQGKIHGFRWAAKNLMTTCGPATSDEQKDQLQTQAVRWAARFSEDHATDLLVHFFPPLTSCLGLSAEMLLAEVRRARQPNPSSPQLVAPPLVPSPAWETPLPLPKTAPAPSFPLEVFPDPLRQACTIIAATIQAPVDFAAAALLAAVSASLGARRALAIKQGHAQRGALYLAIIAEPGSAKSPVLGAVMAPIKRLQQETIQRWKQEKRRYEELLEQYEDRKRARKRSAKGEDPPEGRSDPPAQPLLRRYLVERATVEALGPILEENPAGILCLHDELGAWIAGQNEYKGGKGSDSQFWLSAWSGEAGPIDRKGDHDRGPLFTPYPFVTVIGNLTPDDLSLLRTTRPSGKKVHDGFCDRILLVYPDEFPASEESWCEIPDTLTQYLDNLYARLRSLSMEPLPGAPGDTVQYRPFIVGLEPETREVWQTFTREHAAEVNAPDFPGYLKGPWSKLKGYCARLALLLHYLHWACADPAGPSGDKERVNATMMTRAVTLLRYFKGMAQRTYALIDGDARMRAATRVWEWLDEHPEKKVFTRRDLHQGLKRNYLFVHPDSLHDPLKVLETYGWIRMVEEAPGGKPGRPRSVRYERNPRWPAPGSGREKERETVPAEPAWEEGEV